MTMRLPVQERLRQLRCEAEKAVGSQIRLKYFAEQSSPHLQGKWGRYEHENRTLWIKEGLSQDVDLYVKAHELCHALQHARGYPRISITETLRNCKVWSFGHHDYVHPSFIVAIHDLSDQLSTIVLDPSADNWACAYGLLTEQALQEEKPSVNLQPVVLLDFNDSQFHDYLRKAFEKAGHCLDWQTSRGFDIQIAVISCACRYVNLYNRLVPYGLFDEYNEAFKKVYPKAHSLSHRVAEHTAIP